MESYALTLLRDALRDEIKWKKDAEAWLLQIDLKPESRNKRNDELVALASIDIANERIPDLVRAIKKLKLKS